MSHSPPSTSRHAWLKRRLAVARVDGQSDGDWAHFAAKVRAGDELWTFASPQESWRILAGVAGVALVRGGQIVEKHAQVYS